MKHNQKITLAIGLGVVILLNIVLLGWLLTDFFSGPNGPEETASTIDSCEVTTEVITTMPEETSTGETTEEPTTEEITTEEPSTEEPSTEEPSTEVPIVEWTEKKISLEEAKRVVHTFSWGDEEGQLKYHIDHTGVEYGPEALIIEDGLIYILDQCKKQILIVEDNQCQTVKIDYFPLSMIFQDGWLGVLGSDIFTVFRMDRNVKISMKIPQHILNVGSVRRILEIGETYVVLELYMNVSNQISVYQFDWISGKYEPSTAPSSPPVSGMVEPVNIIGEHGESVYYYHFKTEETDGYNYQYVINREVGGCRLYTGLLKTDDYHMIPDDFTYLSTDGHLYIMECFEDRVEISELTLE